MADPIYGKAPKVKGKKVAVYKGKDRDNKSISYKTVEKVTPAGEKVSIKTTKYKSQNAKGTKSITKITGNEKNMTGGKGLTNAATRTYITKRK